MSRPTVTVHYWEALAGPAREEEPEHAALNRALSLLGPLEGRIMRAVWSGRVPEEFVVRDVLALVPDLAYTTVMTTLRRLADKRVLRAEAVVGRRAHVYRVPGGPAEYLVEASRREAARIVDRYGEAALAAFAARLARLTPAQRHRLEALRDLS